MFQVEKYFRKEKTCLKKIWKRYGALVYDDFIHRWENFWSTGSTRRISIGCIVKSSPNLGTKAHSKFVAIINNYKLELCGVPQCVSAELTNYTLFLSESEQLQRAWLFIQLELCKSANYETISERSPVSTMLGFAEAFLVNLMQKTELIIVFQQNKFRLSEIISENSPRVQLEENAHTSNANRENSFKKHVRDV